MNRITDYSKLKSSLVEWIKSYTKKYGIKTLVVGVSGGIDSAVVSTLCAETGIKTIIVGMPLNSTYKNNSLSEQHIKFLCEKYDKNVNSYIINLTGVYEEFLTNDLFKTEFNSELGLANTKSRLRMITLYQIASSKNGIVVGTGNKVEDFGVGFFTKYGDGGVDISPISDLYKSEVRELGKFLNVSEDIITATPTDGLWDDERNDEQQIGATYDELEWVMEYGLTKSYLSERENEIINIYTDFNTKNKHKMVSIPVFNLKENNII
jgi:NAD+ synthase